MASEAQIWSQLKYPWTVTSKYVFGFGQLRVESCMHKKTGRLQLEGERERKMLFLITCWRERERERCYFLSHSIL
jgi:hypothetical protein